MLSSVLQDQRSLTESCCRIWFEDDHFLYLRLLGTRTANVHLQTYMANQINYLYLTAYVVSHAEGLGSILNCWNEISYQLKLSVRNSFCPGIFC